jgi:hypothetical protein
MTNLFLHTQINPTTTGYPGDYHLGKSGKTGLDSFFDILKSNKKRDTVENITYGLINCYTFVRL